MYEVRFHGRGGQGAVTAANILAVAAFNQGYHVQAFPNFGVERRGAPVEAYVRMDSRPIEIREQVYTPDAVVVLDPSLMEVVDVAKGLKEGGIIIINSAKKPEEFNFPGYRVATVDATEIAVQNRLGSREAPIVNTAILGAYARAVGNVDIEHVVTAVKNEAPVKPDENAKAAREAYEATVLGW